MERSKQVNAGLEKTERTLKSAGNALLSLDEEKEKWLFHLRNEKLKFFFFVMN
jgi:hypothetical protein